MSALARILVIDAGTTGIRALVYDEQARIVAQAYTEFPQYHPGPDRVEQDAMEIWDATRRMVAQALGNSGTAAAEITAVGITNQRATTVIWDRETGLPITRAIVWQDTRTADRAAELEAEWGERAYRRTGWSVAPVYSSLSIEWVLRNVDGARELADAGRLAFGTIDSWLVYQLTGRAEHVISASNASVTGSYDLIADEWYTEWLDRLGIPVALFPQVRDDSGVLGHTTAEAIGARIPIASAIADQHSALFAQGCIRPGAVKCTHGTGTFLDMTIGSKPVIDPASGLTSQIAWRIGGQTVYALEGYAGSTGAAVQWLRDGAAIIADSAESETVARRVADNGGVFFVPALTGLSAPYWDPYARGTIIGISPGTERGHLARATLEGIVFSVRDFVDAMSAVSGYPITQIAVDGGASRNDLLMQFQADQLDAVVTRPKNTEATSLGAALLAGLATGVWQSPEEAVATVEIDATFTPRMDAGRREDEYAAWRRAVERARGWLKK
ncbi:glycerol kinase GlpK [Amycolatopsis rubida]|uniref:ATP:glycerol 3-phosphotransferase n=1 Tax=Amycolatopsis rubida TaxID=112413 RepID=A0ABX0BZQ7_9PSEU|nr:MULTISPECIES: glycerol kinase GlpK [Amycolatopsis]MYW96081.1 glycerol kinase GlpK [Amycolatopsis rubida]NEC61072.1 glycerol kinase GlpK [Amycolatopsis rubida]OAP23408.1 Glycerol kinase [Amycolatopsis sp. M39]